MRTNRVKFKNLEHNENGEPVNIEFFGADILQALSDLATKLYGKSLGGSERLPENIKKSAEYMKLEALFDDWKYEFMKVFGDNKELAESIKMLTFGKFVNDLEEARFFYRKYFKTPDGKKYIYVRSIEVDGSCELMRGGYNAEDYGVYIQWIEIEEGKGISRYEWPVHMLVNEYHTDSTKSQKWVEIDREEYTKKMNSVTEELSSPVDTGEMKYDIDAYCRFLEERFRIDRKYERKLKKLLEDGKENLPEGEAVPEQDL